MSAVPGLASAQAYINTTETRAFEDISAVPGCTPTVLTFTSADDGQAANVPIGFTFSFLGNPFTTVNLGSNGYMAFGSQDASSLGNVTLGQASAPNNFIAPFWDDLVHPTAMGGRYCTVGAAPNRVFVIQGGPAIRYTGSGNLIYQIRLYEGVAGRFEYSLNGGVTFPSASATIGYEGANGMPFFSPLPCGATATCVDTVAASLNGQVFTTFIANAPELTGSFGTTWVRGAFPGQSASGPVIVRNLAIDSATDVTTEIYLSANTTYEATDVLIGTVVHASVPGGNQPRTVTASVTIPANTAPGDYYFIARIDSTNAYPEAVETDNTVVSTFRFATAYDLVPTAASSANGGNPGDPIAVNVTIGNAGVPYAGPVGVTVYASLDQIFDVSDPRIADGIVTHNGSATQSFTVNGNLPNLAPGSYFPIVVLDTPSVIVELNETNNSLTSNQSFPTGPDFTITAVTIPPQAAPNSAFEVATTVGSVAVPYSGPVAYRLYLSDNNTYEPADTLLGTFSVTFSGNRSEVSRQMVTMPTAAVPGAYYVVAVADPLVAVLELNENNNNGVSTTTVLNGYDFRVAAVNVTATNPEPGQPITVTANIQSVGLPYSGNLAVGVYASPDNIFDQADILIYTGNVNPATLTSVPFNQTFNLAPTTPIATYNIIVVADPASAIPETNEMNNSAASSGTVRLRGADLIVRTVSGPDFGFGGQTYPITVTIANEGEAVARGMQWAVYYSENDIIRVTDQQVYVSPAVDIAIGAAMTFTATIALPVETATVTRYMGAFADIFSRVPETRETNNVRALANGVRVLFPVPDLSGGFVETATAAAAGEQFAITRILRNEGVADAASFDYAYYLSSNPTISSDDVLLAQFSASIAVGADDYGIDIVTLPSGIVPGTYYLGMVLDPALALDQVTRSNDTVVGPSIAVYGAAIRFVTDRLPSGTIGVPYEAGIYANGGAVARSWSISDGRLPGGLTLDAMSGIISGSPSEEGNFEFTVRASAGTAYADRPFVVRITAPTVTLTVATNLLPPAVAGRPYDANVIAVGGVVPYVWSTISSVPPGLTLDESGRLHGTPTAPGNFRIVVRVRDDVGTPVSKEIGLNVINPSLGLLIQQQSLRVAAVGVEYCDPDAVAFTAMGGIAPYKWRIDGAGVPGLTITEQGTLCGVPERAGDFPILVRVDDQTGLFDTSLFIVEVESGTELAVATGELPRAELNKPYAATLTAVRGEMPYVWTKIQGELPPGVTMTEAGVISGTPTGPGTFAFTVQLTDARLRTDVRPLSIIVVDPTLGMEPIVEDGGCGCATSRSSGGEALLALVGMAVLGLRRRRTPITKIAPAMLAVCLATMAVAAEAQTPVNGTPYVMARRPITYTSIGAAGTQILGPGLNAINAAVSIPFQFKYYDTLYTSVNVSSASTVNFTTPTTSYSNTAFGTTSTPNAVIGLFWDDLETADADGSVVYAIEGVAPTRVLVIEWRNINEWGATAPRIQAQLRLHEGLAGRIQVRYGPIGTGADLAGSMGMEDEAGRRPINFDPATPPCTTSCSNATLTAVANTEIELVQDPGIELVALSVDAPAFGFLGASVDVPVRIANLNGSTIGPFTYSIEASRSRNMANPVRIFTSGGVTFPPYSSTVLHASVLPPVTLGEGEYYLQLVVDSGNAIGEVDEANNRVVSVGRIRILQGKPDLAVERVTVSTADARAGGMMTVYGRITNKGSDPATARSAVMLSSNPAITPQDLSLAAFNVTLAPGQTITTTQTVTLPADTNSGAYYVGVQLDVDNTVDELSESNNGRAAFRTVSVSGAGLAITTTRLPSPALGIPYVALLTATGGVGTYRWEITQGMLPAGIGLVPNTGELFGRAARAESQTFTVRVTSGSDSATRQLTLSPAAPAAPLTIVSRSAPVGSVGQEYAFSLIAVGGSQTATQTWSATGLPAGLEISPRGELIGIPTAAGSSTGTISLTDGTSTTMRDIGIRVRPSGGLSISPVQLTNATLGMPYSAMLEATGGTPPFTWTVELGALPEGVTLQPTTGLFTGTPTQVGRFRVVVRVRDAAALPSSDTNTFELDVVDAGGFDILATVIPTAHVGEAFDVTIESMGGTAPYTWTVAEGRLPPGISSELRPETGKFRIVGTPTEINVSNILVQVTDGAGRTAIRAFAIDVQAPKPVIVNPIPVDSGGCSTGVTTDGAALAMLLVIGLALRATRRKTR